MALDLNRGVMTKFHPSGIKVSMYLDDPGTYIDDNGQRLDDKFATDAGFDIEKHRKDKIKAQRLAAYKAQLDAEMATEEEALASAMSQSPKYDVRHIGAGQYALFDKSGKRLTRVAMTRADVELLIGPVADPAGGELDPNQVPKGFVDLVEKARSSEAG